MWMALLYGMYPKEMGYEARARQVSADTGLDDNPGRPILIGEDASFRCLKRRLRTRRIITFICTSWRSGAIQADPPTDTNLVSLVVQANATVFCLDMNDIASIFYTWALITIGPDRLLTAV